MNVTSLGTPAAINFESTVANVNNGEFTGGGFAASPAAGQLDSGAWSVTDLSGTQLSRGYTSSGGSSEGIYSFDVLGGGTSHTLGVKPDNNDFNPGTITLRVQNSTGVAVGAWAISYDLFTFNNTNSSSTFNFEYSTTGVRAFTPVPAVNFSSPGAADAIPAWVSQGTKSATIAASVANTGILFLRWTSTDSSAMGGTRDSLALDNISVSAVPEPTAFLFGGLVCGVIGVGVGTRRLFAVRQSDG